jgi:Beta propeller domain/Vault protein inter-alpha-trypsin domain
MRSFLLVFLVGCGSQSALGYLTPPPSTSQETGLSAINRALDHAYAKPHVEPPVRLVPTDGSELALRGLAATVDIDGPTAHTELHFRFHNAEERQREGRFTITLPPNAAVTRFTMKIAGEWREARIVARAKGREVYERFLHRRVDPALLEQDLGNVFSARVFPIEGLEDKEIIVAYDHQVSSARGYTLALAGLPRIGALAIAVDNNGAKQTIARENELPADLQLDVMRGSDAVAAGQAFVARIEGAAPLGDAAPLDRVLYLVDTSASRAPVMGKQAEVLRRMLRAQGRDTQAAVIAFDQTTVEVYRGIAAHGERAASRLFQHGALGGSDLGAALARATTAGMSRVVIIGDGMPTLGEHDATKLAAIVSGSRIERVDVVQVGESLDRVTLQPLVRAGKQPGAVLDGSDAEMVTLQLASAVVAPVAISVEGATQTWPATTKDVAPGEPVFVYGLRDGTRPLVAKIGGKRVELAPKAGDTDRLRRVVAGAELIGMVEAQASGEAIEKHALAFQLVSSRTSMIVLETLADEQRFLDPAVPGIDQDFTRNIPTGRTFQAVLGDAAGSQSDSYGVSLSGSSSSVENTYIVDGINTTGLTFGSARGESICIPSGYGNSSRMTGTKNVYADVISPLALDIAAEQMWRNPIALANNDLVGAMVSGGQVYASTESIYVSAPAYIWNQQGYANYQTQIHQFALTKNDGRPTYVASGAVDGQLLNQFSMSEHEGNLRVATTDWNWNGNEGGNHLFVLHANAHHLDTIGAIRGLAKGERIYAGRMFGDKGYLVTFRQTDPLFTLDLSDPRHPKVAGELKINGFSNYIHPMDDNLLLAIGQDADDTGRVQGFHMQVFDVTDPAPHAPLPRKTLQLVQLLHERRAGRSPRVHLRPGHRHARRPGRRLHERRRRLQRSRGLQRRPQARLHAPRPRHPPRDGGLPVRRSLQH